MLFLVFGVKYDIMLLGEFMRLKNVKGAKELIEASSYVIQNPKDYCGRFVELFDQSNPIHVEIGMGKGQFVIGMAQKYPDINFVGIEKFDSVLVRAVQKLEHLELKNLKLIRMDALEIDEIFSHEIAQVYLNFSDPWPKNRHQNRRLTSPVFLTKYDTIFQGNPSIAMKTDNRHLFEYSLMSFTDYGYHMDELSLNLYEDDISDNVATEYEERFVARNNVIYYVKVSK